MGEENGQSDETEADRLLRMMTDAMAAEFGHASMMEDEPPDRIDLAYRAAMAYFGSSGTPDA